MKVTILNFSMAVALVLAMAVASSCGESFRTDGARDVRFSASAGGGTKAAYSGERVFSGGVARYERIDWVPASDVVRVWCPQGRNSEPVELSGSRTEVWADYVVDEASVGTARQTSVGTMVPGSEGGLRWSDGVEHRFYGIYPSPLMRGTRPAADDIAVAVDPSGVATVSATVPAAQAVASVAAKANRRVSDSGAELSQWTVTEYEPDMYYLAMAGYASAYPSAGTVSLAFYPLVSAIRVELFAGEDDAMPKEGTGEERHFSYPLTRVEIVKTTDGGTPDASLCGRFTATIGGGSTPGVPQFGSLSAGGDKVSVDLSSQPGGGVTLYTDRSRGVALTLLLAPQVQDHLTLRLAFAAGGGTEEVRTLKLMERRSGVLQWLEVAPAKKVFLDGVVVDKAGTYVLDLGVGVDPWSAGGEF